MILSHQQDPAGLGLPEGQRPVFVRYDREEAEDVEISLASDSDDSVVIVPPGMLNLENPQDEAAASGAQNMTSAAPAGATVSLTGGDPAAIAPAAATTIDRASLPNDLATSSPLLTTSAAAINSFPPPSSSVVSLVPPLNSNALAAPPGGLGDSLPGRPQLQQMLMQPSASGQPGAMGMPLQMHQLQNQLGQQGRHLHQHQPPPASNEDSAVININSTDEEEEEEEEEDEDLDEEEEGMDEEEEEEEDVSDFPEEDLYDGEYDNYDEEEGEELEEEEEEEDEDGDIPPLEGAEDNDGEAGVAGGKVLRAAMDEEGLAGFSLEGEAEGGIEEIQANRSLFAEDRIKVQKVESIGVLEEARGGEGEGEEDESERMDDPTMPQILCVTGGALEEREETEEDGGAAGVLLDGAEPWEEGANEVELTAAADDCATNQVQQELGAEPAQEAGASDKQSPGRQEEQLAAVQEGDAAAAAADPQTSTGASPKEPEETTDAEKRESATAEETEGGGDEGDAEEGKGLKRKREETAMEEEAGPVTEKKKVDDEVMASMLADFVACPPDDEDGASGSNRS